MSSASGAGRSQQRSKSRSAGSGRSNSESVTVFLRLRPTPTPGATSLFEVADDSKSVTLHAPIGAGAAHESRINAASPATAMKLTFGLGRTPSKIKRTPVRNAPKTPQQTDKSPRTPRTPTTPGGNGLAPTPWRTPARSKPATYRFDNVFGPDASQAQVFEHVKPVADTVVSGINATVMAYGATGAGKTHTIMGDKHHAGMLQRLLHTVFKRAAAKSDTVFTIMLTYVELYNNKVRDLLAPVSKPKHGHSRVELPRVTMHEVRGRVRLSGTETLRVPISNLDEALNLLRHGNKNRAVGCTDLNSHSSRSHAILMVDVESQQAGGPGRKNPVRMSRLTIVDLAGAERLAVSGTGDDPTLLAETQSINSSLTALADVLSALSSNNQELWLIPYRNNPLTWLLRDALGGNSKTIMLAHCHSTAQNFRQSKVTLMYATRAKKIRNRIRSNVVAADDSELQAKMVVIERLRDTITANREQLRKAQERRDEAVKEAVHLRQELARVAEQQRTARAATPAAAATPGAVAATAKPAGTEHSEQDDDSEQTIAALKEELRKAQARADGAMMSELSDTLRRLQRLAAEKRFLEMQLAASTDAEHQQATKAKSLEKELHARVGELETQKKALVNAGQLEALRHTVELADRDADAVAAREKERKARLQLLLQGDEAARLRGQLAASVKREQRLTEERDHMQAQRDAVVESYAKLVEQMEQMQLAWEAKVAAATTAADAGARATLMKEHGAAQEAKDARIAELEATVTRLQTDMEAASAAAAAEAKRMAKKAVTKAYGIWEAEAQAAATRGATHTEPAEEVVTSPAAVKKARKQRKTRKSRARQPAPLPAQPPVAANDVAPSPEPVAATKRSRKAAAASPSAAASPAAARAAPKRARVSPPTPVRLADSPPASPALAPTPAFEGMPNLAADVDGSGMGAMSEASPIAGGEPSPTGPKQAAPGHMKTKTNNPAGKPGVRVFEEAPSVSAAPPKAAPAKPPRALGVSDVTNKTAAALPKSKKASGLLKKNTRKLFNSSQASIVVPAPEPTGLGSKRTGKRGLLKRGGKSSADLFANLRSSFKIPKLKRAGLR